MKSLADIETRIIETVDMGIFILDPEFRVQRWNPWIEEKSGIPEAEILHRNIFDVFPSLREQGFERRFREVVDSRSFAVLSQAFHSYLLPFPTGENPRESGAISYMQQQVKIMPLLGPNNDVVGILTSIEDVTEMVRHEEQLRRSKDELERLSRQLQKQVQEKTRDLDEAQRRLVQSEKLSLIGEIISGIAHEINNPLSVILGYSQLLLNCDDIDRVKRDVPKVYAEAKRCRDIVLNLLCFVREHKPEKIPLDLNKVLRDSVQLRSYQLEVDNVAVTMDLSNDLPPVLANYHQIQQVVLNIVNNAQQAMAEMAGDKRLCLRSHKDGGMARLDISNNGPAIPPQQMEHIFEPFFTSKEEGVGTGLGLSVSRDIIQDHGGRLWAESEDTQTHFCLTLPAALQPGSPSPTDGQEEATARALGKAILVVDDEPALAGMIADMLGEVGHRVETAGGGEEALGKLRSRYYDIIITDMRMKGMDGPGLYDRILDLHPDLADRVIFITGDALNDQTRNFIRATGNPYLRKPFTREELVTTIETLVQRLELSQAGD